MTLYQSTEYIFYHLVWVVSEVLVKSVEKLSGAYNSATIQLLDLP